MTVLEQEAERQQLEEMERALQDAQNPKD